MSAFLSVCMFACLSVYMFVCLPGCLSVCLYTSAGFAWIHHLSAYSITTSINSAYHLSFHLFVCLYAGFAWIHHLSAYSITTSINSAYHLSFHLFVCLYASVCLAVVACMSWKT